jgi:hypothetical protein
MRWAQNDIFGQLRQAIEAHPPLGAIVAVAIIGFLLTAAPALNAGIKWLESRLAARARRTARQTMPTLASNMAKISSGNDDKMRQLTSNTRKRPYRSDMQRRP